MSWAMRVASILTILSVIVLSYLSFGRVPVTLAFWKFNPT
jgi:hypothetical protein